MASTTSADVAAPNRTITSVKTVVISVRRAAMNSRLPSVMSRGEIGVAYIAWKIRLHSSPLMIGKVASNDAEFMAAAASNPGARNSR